MCPGWAEDILTQDGVPEWNEETMATIEKEQSQWTSVEQCEAECNRRLEKFFAYVQTIKDEDLSKTKWLPFDGGRDFTYMEMMDYPRWNFNYHLGQIGYIQIMYGDKDMH
jgi:catalase